MIRSKQIQGLRALSVIIVLLYHADWLPGGFIGVDVFYVISGYLITNLILKDDDFSYRKFYARRAKRLLPAAFTVLLTTAIIFFFVAPALSRIQFSKDLFSSTWYFANYNFAYWQNDYQNLGSNPSPLIHFWSLAVEEQFYLIWPILLILLRKRLQAAVIFVIGSSFIFSILLIESYPIWSFYSLPTRAFELAIGAFFAVRNTAFQKLFNLKFAPLLGIGLILLAAFLFDDSTKFPGFAALLPCLGAVLIILCSSETKILSNRFGNSIGNWSYSIYLWHWPLLTLPIFILDRKLVGIEKTLALMLTFVLAAFTYRFIENPIRMAELSHKRVFLITATSGLVLSSIALLMYSSGQSVAKRFNLSEVTKQPLIYATGCQLDKRATAPEPRCVYGDRNSSKKVVLLGDSHAAQWFPAIDKWSKRRNFQLVVMTKSSCPASELKLKDINGFTSDACDEFRKNAISRILEMKPDLLIFGSAENHKEVKPSDYLRLPKFAIPALVLQDTPWPNRDIPTCIANGDSCDIKYVKPIPYPGFFTFNPKELLCEAANCPAIIDGIIAYRDHSHISVAISEYFYPALAKKLDAVVAG